ncbi:MAG: hypothetical protein ABFS19_12920 [Thermodesulfobacteriota bacterium]
MSRPSCRLSSWDREQSDRARSGPMISSARTRLPARRSRALRCCFLRPEVLPLMVVMICLRTG